MVASATTAQAQPAQRIGVDLPAQPLGRSLQALALLSHRTVLADATLIGDRQAPSLQGAYSIEDALRRLLDGSGLTFDRVDEGFIVRPSRATGDRQGDSDGAAIVVTGSRIRGAPIASPVTILSEQTIRDTGLADLGDVARSLPQSFGGGQNPGVGFNVPSSTGGNVGGGSSVNLRGLGSDATLTILNGRRVPYDSARQGVDISAIPLAAVDRIEIVADGASAIYGSDAVGGVVNVILKRDYDGLQTRARIGGATDGGDFEQRYSVLAGSRWQGGGGLITYEYNRNSDLITNQRDYARVRPNVTILPSSRRHAIAASAHQDITGNLTIEADALYNRRTGAFTYPLNAAGDLAVSRTRQTFDSYTLALASAARLSVGPWQLSLSGTFGKGRTYFQGDTFRNDQFASRAFGRYDNQTVTGEVAGDGPLFLLPGGEAKLAIGAGIRANDFEIFRGAGNINNARPSQDSRYAFAEINLPVVGPDLDLPLVHRLNLSGALRYERYRQIGEIVTPKLGLTYAPGDFVDVKASWGRSFRAPSFIQLYSIQQALLYPVTTFGGTGYPMGATALYLTGGNSDLKPERARSWSITLALHPPAWPGASLEFSYFSTRYVNRIVTPIPIASQALGDPANGGQITLSPTPAQLAALVAGANEFINATTSAYDPTKVVAVIDNSNVNAGRQSIRGIDVQGRYQTTLADGRLSLSASATYLDSKQQISATQPVRQLAGTLFNPPHWRGRGTASWDKGGLGLALTISHIGGVDDQRTASAGRVHGMTTADVSLRYRIDGGRDLLDGVELGLSVQNLTNEAPAVIATSLFYDTPYDSTNYSPVGRFLAFELVKKW
ncbi:TonB-dependent receptor [Sphingobium yanoikuyae]|uniref:TonB-dependent receptor n=1 Tax=Sphingobium yanoikuyae TaxID=13690 RepID=UPI00241DD71D|nr:TonB-dependent receptor [Sphingobium yanoikuyae]